MTSSYYFFCYFFFFFFSFFFFFFYCYNSCNVCRQTLAISFRLKRARETGVVLYRSGLFEKCLPSDSPIEESGVVICHCVVSLFEWQSIPKTSSLPRIRDCFLPFPIPRVNKSLVFHACASALAVSMIGDRNESQ